jgi:spermidine dehydrogenase
MRKSRDRELGMSRKITRRDFINGVVSTAGATMLPHLMFSGVDFHGNQSSPKYYPPALTGLRGSHVGSFEVAHRLRDGTFWEQARRPTDTGETYDLIVVGGGISGLSAAHFYRKVAGPRARILILDNHDDFGGHAKRNEFTAGNRRLLGFGGTFSIESPAPYSAIARSVIQELGIKVASYPNYVAKDLYRSYGLAPSIFFDKETFGADRLLPNPTVLGGGEDAEQSSGKAEKWKKFMSDAPLSDQAKKDLERLYKEKKDYLPGLSSDEKKAHLARLSYAKFLSDTIGTNQEVIRVFQAVPQPLFGVGIDAISAQDAWGLGFPGFEGMNLAPGPGKGMNRDAIPNDEAKDYFFHFPDGNASIARLLVRQLIPEAIPGNSSTDVVTALADYAKLDQASSAVRIRLNSTVVRVKHDGDPASAKEIEVTYSQAGQVFRARAAHGILACWHVVIPYFCEELPDPQKEALSSAAKVPLLYTNVALRNWTAHQKLGASSIYAPGSYHTFASLDLPVSIGGYECSRKPEEPIVMHMMKTPCKPGLPARDQHRMGRIELFTTSFETMERNIRDQLARSLGPGGFDPARDISAITVNRWPHGYAYEYNSLWDKFWLEGTEAPCEVARKPFGRLAIANADADAYAYTDCAIDQAYRAVQEITRA